MVHDPKDEEGDAKEEVLPKPRKDPPSGQNNSWHFEGHCCEDSNGPTLVEQPAEGQVKGVLGRQKKTEKKAATKSGEQGEPTFVTVFSPRCIQNVTWSPALHLMLNLDVQENAAEPQSSAQSQDWVHHCRGQFLLVMPELKDHVSFPPA